MENLTKEQIIDKICRIYTSYRDYYDGDKFKPVISYELAESLGEENMWWINLSNFDEMFNEIFEIFDNEEIKKKIDEIGAENYNAWKVKQEEFKIKQQSAENECRLDGINEKEK